MKAKKFGLTTILFLTGAGTLSGCAGYVQNSIIKDKDLPLSKFIEKKFTGQSDAPVRGTYVAHFNEMDMSQVHAPKRYLTIYCQAQGGELVLTQQSKINPLTPLRLRANQINTLEDQQHDRTRLEIAYEKTRANGAVGQLECKDATTQKVRWKVSIEPTDFRPENPSNLLQSNLLILRVNEVQ
jgi:hypothetical protein